MCGRYYLASAGDILKARFRLHEPAPSVRPRYNIAPSQEAPVVIEDGGRRLVTMRWGLVPSWASDPSAGFKTINARAETAASRPSFEGPMRRRRALVPAEGFYEWRAVPGRRGKVPYAIRLKSRAPFAFAGLWDLWSPRGGPPLLTFTILTTAANETVAPIHDRMPVLLTEEAEARWLDPRIQDPAKLSGCLVPYPGEMEAVAVSNAVSSPANDGPECLEPAPAEAPPRVERQRGLFEE